MSDPEETSIEIVVVDDEEIVLSLVRDALEDEGYAVHTASSAESALEVIEARDIGLIVTDIRMPRMDGLELVRRARTVRSDVVAIFMTGYANLNSAKDAISQGAFAYIQKPFELNEIRQTVAGAVERVKEEAARKQPSKELDRLSDFGQMLYAAGDRKSLATLSLKFAVMHCDAASGAILYWNAERTAFDLVNIAGEQTDEPKVPEKLLSEALNQCGIEQFKKPFVITKAEEHPFCKAVSDPQMSQYVMPKCSRPLHSVVVVPVIRADSFFGIITVGFDSEDVRVKDEDLKFLAISGSQLALSLENILLLEEAQEAYKRLRELQDETIQLEKMATRGEISAEIGHELNNFLGVVAGNLSLLDFSLKAGKHDQLGKYVQGITDNIEKMKTFTSNLMDLTPISSHKETIAFDKLLAEVIDYLRPQKRYSEVVIRMQPIDQAILFEADSTHIQQLLYNLFNNAADATVDCERREIDVEVEVDRSAGTFGMSIRDTGSGIDPELLKKAFQEKFTTKENGHGFGLLVCKRIIESHNGKLTVESTPGQGTTIRVDFPLIQNEPVSQTAV